MKLRFLELSLTPYPLSLSSFTRNLRAPRTPPRFRPTARGLERRRGGRGRRGRPSY